MVGALAIVTHPLYPRCMIAPWLVAFMAVMLLALPAAAQCTAAPAPGVDWRRCLLDRRDLKGVDLTGAVLRDANLQRADLTGAVLREVEAVDSRFNSALMANADLTRANLRNADLTRADLKGAKLKDADLRQARLFRADLRNADLTGAELTGADLSGTELAGATWTDGTRICGPRSVGLCQ